jgi:hypothetical protein
VVSARILWRRSPSDTKRSKNSVRTTRPSSRKARYSRFWRLRLPSLRRSIDGSTLPAWIDRTTVVPGGVGLLQDLSENSEQRFLDSTLVVLHRMQMFHSPVPGFAHPPDEHLDELIPSLGLSMMRV